MFESLFLYATLFEYIVFLKYFCQTITSTKSHFFPDISPSHFKRFNLHQNGFIVPYDHKFNSLSHFPIEWWMYRWLDIGGLTTRKRFLPGTFRRALVSFPPALFFFFRYFPFYLIFVRYKVQELLAISVMWNDGGIWVRPVSVLHSIWI